MDLGLILRDHSECIKFLFHLAESDRLAENLAPLTWSKSDRTPMSTNEPDPILTSIENKPHLRWEKQLFHWTCKD